jgi:starch-binding outer membrane protein, SusD/RagB family
MAKQQYMRGARPWRVAAAMLATGFISACSVDTVLDVTDPDVLNVGDFNSAAGANPLRFGVIGDFAVAFSGTQDGFIVQTGNMADEIYSVDTFDDRLLPNARRTNENLPALDGTYRNLHRARSGASRTISILEEFAPTPAANIGEVYALRGFTEIFFAEMYCSGVPFSEEDGITNTFGQPQTTTEILTRAVASFDAAIAAAGTDPRANMAKIGKARALLNLGQFAAAAAAVSGVPTSYSYQMLHSAATGRQTNGIWTALTPNASRFAVRNNEGGTPLTWLQTPADPRMPWVASTRTGFNGTATALPTQLKYPDRGTPVVLAGGVEARLIELEAQLQANTQAARDAVFAGLNNLRATAISPAMAPLPTAPTTQNAAVDLLFQERAYWMWLTGHRLGDLRRLIRQYGRSANSVFPTGDTPPGVAANTYGDDVNFIIPRDEANNPNFTGCLNRDA